MPPPPPPPPSPTDVINQMQTDDMELKKLVYLYLINYAKTQPDLAIMAVNTFVKVGGLGSWVGRALSSRARPQVEVHAGGGLERPRSSGEGREGAWSGLGAAARGGRARGSHPAEPPSQAPAMPTPPKAATPGATQPTQAGAAANLWCTPNRPSSPCHPRWAALQDSQDPNPLIRALAVRTMGCIRVDKITEYLCDPLHRCLKVVVLSEQC